MTNTKQKKPPTERRDYHCEIRDSKGNVVSSEFVKARNENEAAAHAIGRLRFDVAQVYVDDQLVYPWIPKSGQRGPSRRNMDTTSVWVKFNHETARRLRLFFPDGHSAFVEKVVSKALGEIDPFNDLP